MNSKIIDFIREKGWDYKKAKDDNISIKVCPICGGKSNKTGELTKDNMYSFFLDTRTGLYHCFRGSCNAKGHINMLAKKKIITGEYKKTESKFNETEFVKEARTLGKFTSVENSPRTIEFLKERKISVKTAVESNCRALVESGDLFVPCFEEGILVNYKLRFFKPLILANGKDLKTKNSSLGKSVFYGMEKCFEKEKPLFIVEGEIDMLTLRECGIENVVSVPNGSGSVDFVENCYEFLDNFKEIVLWYDNDIAGKLGFEGLSKKLGKYNLYRIESIEKDANDVLKEKGKELVLEYIKNKKQVELAGIVFADRVKRKRIRDFKRVSSGIYGLDYYLRGFREGELTIWSGKNSSGKTTILGQIILNLLEQEQRVFIYSGELSNETLKEWIYSQACSKSSLRKYKDELSNTDEYEVSDEDYQKIEKWIAEKLIIYDKSDIAKEDELINIMIASHHKYGCRNYFLDNLMMMDFVETEKDTNLYLKQSNFTRKVKGFVTGNSSHCHLVVHPYKTDKQFITKDDIGGSGNIVNSADNVLIMHNLAKCEKEEYPARLSVEKNRIGGKIGDITLDFEYSNKRFFTPGDTKEKEKKYSWNNVKYECFEGQVIDDEIPELFKEF